MVFNAMVQGCNATKIFTVDAELKRKLNSGECKACFELGEGSSSFKQEVDCWKGIAVTKAVGSAVGKEGTFIAVRVTCEKVTALFEGEASSFQ